jgi:NAD(P)-dependent dehydrogenase (short-subunit alcohol dehydrogenase family)
MKSRNHDVIVNIIGAAGERFNYDYITGSTGNAALMAFTKSLGGRSLHYGVRIVGINPGPVETDRHIYLMKNRARNELGDEKSLWRIDERVPARARRKTTRNSRHDRLSGIRSFRLHKRRDRHHRRCALIHWPVHILTDRETSRLTDITSPSRTIGEAPPRWLLLVSRRLPRNLRR